MARDAALHAEVILHEYTHGVIARIVQQQSFGSEFYTVGPGATEAWCDFFALALLAQASDEVTDACYAPMAYHSWYYQIPLPVPPNEDKGGSGQPLVNNYYFGHDLYPVTPDLARNPLTMAHLHPDAAQPDVWVWPMNEVYVWDRDPDPLPPALTMHRMISLWTSTLWDVRARIIEKYRALHGPAVGGEMGGEIMLRLALDSLRLCPHVMDPLLGRDALLLADRVYSGGEHHPEIWAAFAARGMGVGATFDYNEFEGGLTITESTTVPVAGQGVQLAQLGAGIYSSPAIGPDGTIYVATAAPDSRLYALRPDGDELVEVWRFPSNPGGAAFYSSPAIGADGMIYIGRYDNRLYAVTPGGGQYGSYLVNGLIFSSPAIGPDGTVYCGVRASTGSLRAWYPDLTPRWSRDLGASVDASPAIGPDGTVYVGALDGRVWAVDGKTGVTKSGWPYATGSPVYSSPAVGGDGTVYFGANNGNLYALSANGQARWVRPLSGELRAPPALGPEGVVYVASTTGSFWAVDAETGVVRWAQAGMIGVRACPAVAADGTVYVGATDGKVYAFNPDGSANGTAPFNASSAIYASPVIGTTGSNYVGTSNGRLYALPGTEGPAQTTWPMFHRNARHTGYDWYPMGEGVELEQTVLCLAVAPDGQVYAGATFTNISGVEAYRLARWNGSIWGSLVSGGPNGPVTALGLRSDHLFFGGLFDNLVPGPNLGRYYGTWQTQPGPNGPVYAMVISTSGDVYVGGQFNSANGIACQNLFKISAGGTYSALGTPVNGVNGPVYALALDGSGRLFVGGTFSSAGGVSCQNVARWNGTSWSAVGGGTDGTVMALAVTGASGNAQVYAGGYLQNVFNGGTPSTALGLARWSESGNLWAAIGNIQRLEPEVGGPGSLVPARVFALALDGTRVYAGGDFTAVNGLPAAAVAVLETAPPVPMWSALGSGVTTLSGVVETIAVSSAYDFVYIGGRFRSAGGTRADGVARWRK